MAKIFHRRRLFIPIVLVLSMAGCAGLEGPSTTGELVNLPPASLPSYAPDDWFLFDNGRLERVAKVEGDKITWTRGGNEEIRFRNPALPRLNWETEQRRGEASFSAAPDALWPLQPGKSIRFTEQRSIVDRGDDQTSRSRLSWGCSVEPPMRIEAAAGRFDAYPIVCNRISDSRNMNVVETRRWYYAPSVGHYVRYERERPNRDTVSRDLVTRGSADGPALALDAELARGLKVVLDQPGDGAKQTITTDDNRSIEVSVGPSWSLDTGRSCRDYEATVDGILRTGSACMREDGRWQQLGERRPLAGS